MEFAKEQENEEDEVGSLSTTFQWQRLRQDGSVSVNHTDSIVHQLWTPPERELPGNWPETRNCQASAPEGSRQHCPTNCTPTAFKMIVRPVWVEGAGLAYTGIDCVFGLLWPLPVGAHVCVAVVHRCFLIRTDRGACSLSQHADATLTPLSNVFYLHRESVKWQKNIYISFVILSVRPPEQECYCKCVFSSLWVWGFLFFFCLLPSIIVMVPKQHISEPHLLTYWHWRVSLVY